jgi:hypothetical protein
VKNGSIFATAAAPNVEVGEAMAQVASAIINKKPYPKTIWFNFQIITKANVAKYAPWSTRLKAGPMTVRFVKKGGRTFVTTKPNFGG